MFAGRWWRMGFRGRYCSTILDQDGLMRLRISPAGWRVIEELRAIVREIEQRNERREAHLTERPTSEN